MAGKPALDYRAILQVLADQQVNFIVVGGVAAVLHGAPLMTFDVDIVHARDPANIDRLLAALGSLDGRYRIRPDRRPDASHLASSGHQLLVTRYGPLDILGSAGADYDYAKLALHAEETRLTPTLAVRVLRLEWIIRLKEEANADNDRAVLPILRRTLEEKSRR